MKAYIRAISYHLPETELSNDELANKYPEWTVEKISAKTGIFSRRISKYNEFSSDLAIIAANKLFDLNKIDKSIIDYLLLCTQSPDYILPTTACILQDKLGLSKNIGAFDFNLGCSGFVYGLGIAKGLILSGQAKNVLLITSETYSKFIHPDDKGNKTIFGDAAAGTLISSEFNKEDWYAEIKDFEYVTDGSGAEFLIIKNGGIRNKKGTGMDIYKDDKFERNDDYLFMDGSAIFNFTAFEVPKLIKKVIVKNNLNLEDIDYFILHQANEFILNTIQKRMHISDQKFMVSLSLCGNTVSSTIPIALLNKIMEGKVVKNKKILLCGFGVGLSMGGVILQS